MRPALAFDPVMCDVPCVMSGGPSHTPWHSHALRSAPSPARVLRQTKKCGAAEGKGDGREREAVVPCEMSCDGRGLHHVLPL